MKTDQARVIEQGVKNWAKRQLAEHAHLPYQAACYLASLRPEDPAVRQAYREWRIQELQDEFAGEAAMD